VVGERPQPGVADLGDDLLVVDRLRHLGHRHGHPALDVGADRPVRVVGPRGVERVEDPLGPVAVHDHGEAFVGHRVVDWCAWWSV
jgi:hypothetical protein